MTKTNYSTRGSFGGFWRWLQVAALVAVFALFNVTANAQVATNGGSGLAATYGSLSAAITALNGATITSPVVITLTGNETAPAGGYSITATGTSTNTITIEGSSSTITAPTPQTSGALNDAIFKIIGGDWITIQNFTMQENASNTTTTAGTNNMTEWGVALLYASTTNGAQNCTIQNNTISLNRTYQNTFGIYSNSTHSATTIATSATATTTAGGNSGLKIYGNSISNINNGIIVVGPTAAADANTGIDIGGSGGSQANTITNFGTTGTFSGYANVSGTVNGILVRNAIGFNVSYNTITSSVGGTTAGTLNGIQIPASSNAPTATFTNNINNNSLSLQSAVTGGTINGINYPSGSASATSTLNVSNNNFSTFGHTVAGASGTITFITISSTNFATTINSNTFTNISVNTTASVTFISNSITVPAGGSQTINSNSIVTAFNKTGAGGTVTGITSAGSSTTGTFSWASNNFSNITVTGATTVTVITNTDGGSVNHNISNNIISNIVGGSSTVTGINSSFGGGNGGTANLISGNSIFSITGSGAITAIAIGSSGTSSTVRNNLIYGLSSTGAAAVQGITSSAPTSADIYGNKIYDLSGSNASTTVSGIAINAGTLHNVYNNLIGDLRATAANAANPLIGLNVSGGSTVNAYYNTVYLAGTSSGALFGSSAISASTTPTVNLRNNIFINKSTANSTGLTVAYRRSSTTLTTYSTSSNNNLFYAGTPSASNLIYFDGTNSDQTLSAFKTRMSTRDAASITENTAFSSLTGSNSGFLHVDPTVFSSANNGAVNISGFTTDFDNDIRQGNAGYLGTGTAPDMGADEFEGLSGVNVGAFAVTSPTAGSCHSATENLTVSVKNYSSATLDFSVNPVTVTASVTGAITDGPFTVTLNSGTLAAGATQSVVMGTINTTANGTYSISASAVVSGDVNTGDDATSANVVINYTTLSVTATATPASLCNSGTSLVAAVPVGGSSPYTYAWNGGATTQSFTSATLVSNTTFTVTVTDACGITATNNVSVTVNAPIVTGITAGSRCGTGTVSLGATGSAGTTLKWYAAASGGSALGTGTSFTTPSIVATTPYYVGASVDVPNSIVTIGAGATTTSSSVSSPYYHGYGGQKSQFIILASELAAAGMSAGNINSVSFEITSLGTTTMNGFGLAIGHTSQNAAVANTAITGLTDVYSNAAQTLTTGVNTYTFSAPFTWNGTSNIVVQVCYSNNNSGGTSSTVKADVTAFNASLGIYADNATSSAVCAATTSTGLGSLSSNGTSTTRPRMIFNATGVCESARASVTATVTAPPSISASATSSTICVGQSTTLNVTSTNDPDYTYTWNGGAGSGASVSVSPSANTTYTVSALDNTAGPNAGCATSATVSITVNPNPSAVTVTPSTSTMCVGGSQTLTAAGGTIGGAGNATIGTATTLTTANGTEPTAFNNRYAQYWCQMVYTAAELQAQGLTAGSQITSIGFTTTTQGDASTNDNFRIYMGTVGSTSTLTGFTTSGLTLVYGSTSTTYTHAVGLNTITLSAPFTWNGTSNLLVDLRHSGVDNVNNAITYYTATGTNTVWNAQTSTAFSTSDYSTTAPAGAGSVKRLNTVFGYSSLVNPTWSWSPNTASTAVVSVSPSSATTYTATATINGCTATGSALVNVSDLAVTASATDAACFGASSGSVTGSASNGAGSYTYSLNGSTYQAGATFSGLAAGTYTVYAKDANNCVVTTSATVNEPATAVSFDSQSSTAPTCHDGTDGSISFSAIGGTGTITYTVNSSAASSPLTGLASGSYTVVATDANGCSATTTITVTNPAAPSVSASNNGPVCAGSSATLDATAGFTSYAWSGPSSFSASTQSASATDAGVYTVLVTDANGCTNTATTTLVVNPIIPVSVSIAASPSLSICTGTSVTFTATPTNGGSAPAYQWYLNGVAQTGETAATYTTSALVDGDQVYVTLGSDVTCPSANPATSNTLTITVTGAISASATIAESANNVCIGTPVTFTVSQTGGGSTPNYEFFVNATSVQNGTSNTYSYSPANGDVVYAIMTSSFACATGSPYTTSSITMTVNPLPAIPTITAGGAISFCPGGSVTLTSSYTGGNVWSTTETTDAITVSASGSYTVTYTDGNGCTSASSAPEVVTVFPANSVSISASGATDFCNPGSVTLTSSVVGGNVWSTTETTDAITVSASGTYSVTNTDANGCTATASQVVNSVDAPTVSIAANCTSILAGNSATLTATATTSFGTITTYQWVLNGSTNVGTNSATFNASTGGSYTCIVTNSTGCTATSNAIVVDNSTALNGAYTIGGSGCNNFTSFANAFAALNTRGVSGNVTVTVAAGYTETAPAGGLALNMCSLGSTLVPSATQTITFISAGAPNPVITAGVGTTTNLDAIVKLVGVDYVTFNGINLTESAGNTTSATRAEWGYALLKCDGNNGANNNTIINCSITLNKAYTSSVGIYSGNHTAASTTGLTYSGLANDPAQVDVSRNGRNTFYGNAIQNVYTGIALNGNSSSSGNQSLNDTLNAIGVIGQAANVITNFGGAASAVVAINETNQRGLSICNNTITGGTGSTSTVTGISMTSGVWGEIKNNTLTLSSSGITSAAMVGITCGFSGGSLANPNIITISGNNVTMSSATMTTSAATGITSSASGTGAQISVTGNTVNGCSFSASTSGAFTGISMSHTSASTVNTVTNNTVTNNSLAGTGQFLGLAGFNTTSAVVTGNLTFNNNVVSNNTKLSTGSMFCIYNGVGTGSTLTMTQNGNTVNGNVIVGGSAACTLVGVTAQATTFTMNANTVTSNSVTTVNGTAAGNVLAIQSSGASTVSSTITNNIVNGVTLGGVSSGASLVRGILSTTASTDSKVISGNDISNVNTSFTTSATCIGIISVNGGNADIKNNKIYNFTPGQNGTVFSGAKGIIVGGGATTNVYNNLIGFDYTSSTPVLVSNNSVVGLEVTAGTTANLYFNTIRLAGSGSGTGFGSSGINLTTTATNVDIRNNIVSNTMNGGGATAAAASVGLRRSATALTGYATTSNNNLWFTTAIPAAATAIYFDGTTAYASLADFKTQVASRESNSVSEDITPSMISTLGSSADFLHITNGSTTLAESGAVGIAGITTDYDGNTRATTPDIGADEFTGTAVQPSISTAVVSPSGNQCAAIDRTVTITAVAGGAPITGVTLSYSYNGGTPSTITLVNTPSTNDWVGTIPAATTPAYAVVTWSATATDGTYNAVYTGTSYQDAILSATTLLAQSSQSVVCNGTSITLNAGASLPVAPSTYTNAAYGTGTSLGDYLTNVTLGSINNSTGASSSPYNTYYSALSTNLTAGNSYTLSGTINNGGTEMVAAWIDYNHNGVFDASEKIGEQASLSFALNFTVPSTAYNGTTRIRVRQVYNTTGIDPYVSYTYGEVEDYNVNISGGASLAPISGLTYSWSDGTSTVGSGSPTTIIPSGSGVVTYSVIGTALSGCTTSASVNVTINPLPAAPTSFDDSQCGTQTPTCSVSGVSGNSFLWYTVPTGGTAISGQTGSTLVAPYTISSTTSFYVSQVDASTGCEGPRVMVTQTVSIPDAITASVSANNVCPGSSVDLIATQTGSTQVYTYTWNGSGVTAQVGQTVTFTAPASAGTYTYNVNAVDGGCAATATVSLTVIAPPSITYATSNVSTVCEGSPVILTAVTGPIPSTSPTAYSFAQSSGSFTSITGTTSTATGDDGTQTSIPIGFDFTYNGGTKTTFGISTNGTIQLGTTATSYTNALASNANVMAPLWDDNNLGTGTIKYETTGSAPNRVLTVEWSGIAIGGGGSSSNPTGSFQVQLFETSNVIKFNYGTINTMSSVSASIGISGTVGSYLSVTPGAPATVSSSSENTTISANTFLASGTVYTFTPPAQPGPGSLTWTWNPGSISGNSVTVNPTTTTTYTVTATDPVSGCTASSNVLITVNPLPIAPTASNSTQCGNGIPTCSVSTTESGVIFNWYSAATGGTLIQSGGSTLTSTSISATTTFYVSAMNVSTSCEGPRTEVLAEVVQPDAVTASASMSTICIGASVDLSVAQTGTTNSYAYTWNGTAGSGITSPLSGGSQTVTPTVAGTYVYTVNAVDGGCITSSTVTVNVSALPNVSTITATPSTICEGSSSTLSATSLILTAGPQTAPSGYPGYLGTFPSNTDEQIFGVTFGTMSNIQSETCSTNYSDYTSTITAPTVTAGEVVPFTVRQNECDGSTYYSNGLSIFIDWNRDGDWADAGEQVYTSNATSAATGTSPAGDNVRSGNITVPATALAGVTRMRVIIAEGVSAPANNEAFNYGEQEDYLVNVIGAAADPSATFAWNPGSLSGSSVSVSPTTTTTYSLTVTNAAGCSSTSSVTVNVNPVPTAPTTTASTQCGNGIPTASVASTTSATTPVFNWYSAATGGTLIQQSTSNTLTSTSISVSTTFYVSEVYPATGCESPRASVFAEVIAPDAITANASSASICLGSTVDLSVTQTGSTNSYTYTWNGTAGSGITTSLTGGNQTITPTAVGTYVYTVNAVDGTCNTSSTVSVTVNALPSIYSASTSSSTACLGTSVTLTAYAGSTAAAPTTYCATSNAGSSAITNVTINTLNYSSGAILTSPYYESVPEATATTFLVPGNTYTVSITSDASTIVSVWIDFNRDGVYDASEWVQPYTSAASGSASITVPSGAIAGKTGMRVRTRSSGSPNGSTDACTTFFSGETEDYTVTILSASGSFAWTDGTSTVSTSNPATITPTASTTYYAVLTGTAGCTVQSAGIPVTVISTPDVPNVTQSVDTVCVSGNVNFAITNSQGGVSYQWQSSSTGLTGSFTDISGATGLTYSVTGLAATTYYQVVATCGLNTSTSATKLVYRSAPATVSTVGATRCGPGDVTVSASGVGSFEWYEGSVSTTVLGSGSSFTTNLAANTTLWVIAHEGTCYETARTPVSVIINTPPAIVATSSASSICAGQSATLNVTSGNTNYSYSWNGTPGGAAGTGSSVSVTPSTTTVYTVTATDGSSGPYAGCNAVQNVTVVVNALPVISSITTSATSICDGSSFQMFANTDEAGPQTQPTGYDNTSTSSNQGDEQIFAVSFGTMNNVQSETCTSGYSDYTSTIAAPLVGRGATVPFSVTQDECDGATYYANGLSIFIDYNRDGDFNDAGEQAFTTLATSAAAAGSPNVRSGNIVIPATASLGVTRMRVVIAEGVSSPIATGDNSYGETEDYVINIGSTYTYSWTPATNLSSSTVSNPTVSTLSGSQTYSVTATNSFGCSSTSSITVTSLPLPNPTLTVADGLVLCSPNNVDIYASDLTGPYASGYPAGTTVEWIGYGITGGIDTTFVNSSAGSTFQAKVTLPNGCFAYSNTITVVTRSIAVNPVVTPAACGNNNGKVKVTITSAPAAPYHYIWTDGTTTIRDVTNSASSDSIYGLGAGTYYLSIYDNDGGALSCSSLNIPYIVGASSAATLTMSSTNVSCNGLNDGTVGVTVSGGAFPYTYLWDNGSNPTLASQNTLGGGVYNVLVTDALGCTATGTVTVTEPSAIVATFTVDKPCALGTNGSITATVTGGTGTYATLEWYNQDFSTDLGSGLSVTGLSAGDYNYVVVDDNGCSPVLGPFTVSVIDAPAIVVGTITPSTGAVGSTVTLSGSGFTGATGVSFNGTSATVFSVVDDNTITVTVPTGATDGPITVSVGGCTGVSGGSFTVQTNITFNLKAYMQGYYVGGGFMNAALMNQGVGSDPDVTDDITVELRDQFNPSSVVATATTQINTDGTASVVYPGTVLGGNYYVAVYNRTTLPTWSDVVTISTSGQTYDFTTAASQAYGDNQIEVETGVFAFYSGDIAQDEFVDLLDQIQLDNDLFDGLSGYYASDLNGDGFIDLLDQITLDNNLFIGVGSIHP